MLSLDHHLERLHCSSYFHLCQTSLHPPSLSFPIQKLCSHLIIFVEFLSLQREPRIKIKKKLQTSFFKGLCRATGFAKPSLSLSLPSTCYDFCIRALGVPLNNMGPVLALKLVLLNTDELLPRM
jgi:hypothetical protein